MDKKGVSLSGWTEGILFVIMFMGILSGTIILSMNNDYGQTFTTGLGINETDFADTTKSTSDEIKGGEAEFTGNNGLSLLSSWGIILSLLGVIWGFLTGSFITTLCGYMMLPEKVGTIFQLLWTMSLIFVTLKILFRVKAQ